MEWYCALWNSDKASSAAGASMIYELLCEGDTSMVSEFPVVEELYQEVKERYPEFTQHRLLGAVMISCDFSKAEYADRVLQELAKKHGLSYFEPQNLTFVES